jgi:transposase
MEETLIMIVLGVDLHKWSHTAVAVDEHGRKLAERTVEATDAGHLELRRWAGQWAERRWALEDGRHLSRRLEADLLRAGEDVVRVPPKLMAGARRSAREPGKSDPIDALAVARAALREPDLPTARLEGEAREIRLLVDRREDLVAERTREAQRLRWHLLDLGLPEPPPASLDRAVVRARLDRALATRAELVARLAREILARIGELCAAIRSLETEIEGRIRPLAPTLLRLAGCGPLTAAKIVGETGGIARFRSRAAFARHTGTAPIPVWSGNRVRHRLSRGGNRQLNCALHRIAVTQVRLGGPGRAYLERRLRAGDTKTEAYRALRRRLSDEVFRCLLADEVAHAVAPLPLTASAA